MARIKATQLSANSFRFDIIELDTGWAGSDRECNWYMNKVDQRYPIESDWEKHFERTIKGNPSSTVSGNGSLTLSDMWYDTKYWFTVYIYGTPKNGTYKCLATLEITVQTDKNPDEWHVQCQGYDYNGELFIFGRVSSESSKFSHIDITITEKNSGKEYTYRAYADTTNSTGAFNMRTSQYKRTSDAPTILNPGKYTFYVKAYTAAGKLIGDAYLYVDAGNGDELWEYEMHNSLDPPSLYYTPQDKTITITNQGTGRYFLEIRRKNRNKVNTGYSEEVKDYFYTTLVRYLEGGKYHEGNVANGVDGVCQHPTKTLNTIILFDQQAGFTTSQMNEYYQLACNKMDYISSITGVTFSGRNKAVRSANTNYNACVDSDKKNYSDYSMIIRFGNGDTMNFSSGNVGQWSYRRNINDITLSHASIAVDLSKKSGQFEECILEEIFQSLGLGYDSFTRMDSIFWDPGYFNTSKLTPIDISISNMYYKNDLRGYTGFDLLEHYDTPCLLFQDYTGGDLVFDVSKLVSNEDFIAYAWRAEQVSGYDNSFDNDLYSMRAEIEFQSAHREGDRPAQFSWTYPKRSGQPFNLTADEYNGFISHVNEMLEYKGLSTFTYAKINPGTQFLRWDYNDVLIQIQEMGVGLDIPMVERGTPITADITSSDPAKNNINAIVNAVNRIRAND
jgi:hypothetical protein